MMDILCEMICNKKTKIYMYHVYEKIKRKYRKGYNLKVFLL